jgi:hypothetical protein
MAAMNLAIDIDRKREDVESLPMAALKTGIHG